MQELAKILVGARNMINRDIYLNKLINRINNRMIKVVTGIRKCGKSLSKIDDSFKKIIVVRANIKKWMDEKGVLIVGLKEFLTNPEILKY